MFQVFLCVQCLQARPDGYYGRTRKPTIQTCTNSQQCPQDSCCRNTDGNLIGVDALGPAAVVGMHILNTNPYQSNPPDWLYRESNRLLIQGT